LQNPNRLTVAIYPSPEQRSMIKNTNSTRTSWKAYSSPFDEILTSTDTINQQQNLFYQYDLLFSSSINQISPLLFSHS